MTRTGRAEGDAEELGQRRLAGPDPRAEHEDARRDHAEVEDADDDDRDDRRARDVAGRVAVVRGQRGDRLPAGEPPDHDRGGRGDGAPAVRGERGEVAEIGVRKGGERWRPSAAAARRMAMPSWIRPEMRTPNQLSSATPAMMTPAVHIVVVRDPRRASAT